LQFFMVWRKTQALVMNSLAFSAKNSITISRTKFFQLAAWKNIQLLVACSILMENLVSLLLFPSGMRSYYVTTKMETLLFYYYYYYYYLLQLGFHLVAVVLTLVHTIQMDI
jgi:hypothetical protein